MMKLPTKLLKIRAQEKCTYMLYTYELCTVHVVVVRAVIRVDKCFERYTLNVHLLLLMKLVNDSSQR